MGMSEEHQSTTTAAARVCGWKNNSLWWQWAVGMCPYTVHVSCPSLEYKPFSSQPPNHWLSLPAIAVLALGLWKSECVSLQHRKMPAINEQPRFLQLCMYFQPEQTYYTYIFLLQTPHFKGKPGVHGLYPNYVTMNKQSIITASAHPRTTNISCFFQRLQSFLNDHATAHCLLMVTCMVVFWMFFHQFTWAKLYS